MSDQQASEIEDLERLFADASKDPIQISYGVIKSITKNFAQVIGNGGFGVVYLGALKNGMVAVKKLSQSTTDLSNTQFLAEVKCLKRVKHQNIVRFMGYCVESHGEVMEINGKLEIAEVQQRLLCFEYVPNGSLHDYLQEKPYGFDWNIRYQIIKGICEGLRYLHQERIYHLDLKPGNVLLGNHMEPKITDFGLSRCIDQNQSTIITANLYGTLGYIAPESFDKQTISFKSDIYSLGIIMTRLLTGSNGSIAETWHEAIYTDCQQMKRCIEVAKRCAEYDPYKRPTIVDIVCKLNETETTIQKVPPVVKEPRNDPSSSLYQVVKRFQALSIGTLHDDLSDSLAWASRSDYSSLSCLNTRFKLLINSGYLYKLRRKYGIVEHWVYLTSSLMPWEAYDPLRKRWMTLPRMPCDECFSCADKESLAVGTQLLVFGRNYTGLAIWKYDLLTHSWSPCTEMNLPRFLLASGSSGEIAIVAGGCDKNGQVLRSVELYNSDIGHWETIPDMNLPRRLSSGFFMDGKFYVIGGVSSQRDSLTCGEEYNLETRTWRRILDMYPGETSASQSPPLVAVVNNQLYALDLSTNVVRKYDKIRNAWNNVKPLPVRVDKVHNGWSLAFKACGDRLLLIRGHRIPSGEVICLHSWCPEGELADWEVISVKKRAGFFVYNCAIMGC